MRVNNTVVNLSKVSYATFFYVNQHLNLCCHTNPKQPSVNGIVVDNSYAAYHCDYPLETEIERARRLDILDVWTPVVKLQLSNNHSLTYKGKQAIALWNVWKVKCFSRNKNI